MNRQCELLVRNGCLIPLRNADEVIRNGFVAVKDGRILDLGPMSALPPDMIADEVIDANGDIVLPGLVNAHVHSPMTVFRGLADDLPLMTWLNEFIFPAEARNVNEELVYWGTKLACAEMIQTGTTFLADGYFLEDSAAKAVTDCGLRAVMGQGVIDFPAPGVPNPKMNIAHAAEFVDKWQNASSLVKPSVFCHSPYTCSPETLVRSKELAREKGVLFQIHLAETEDEVTRIREERGMSPVEYLDSLELLDENTLAVHCVHLTDDDIELLACNNVPVCVCIESNMKLASGLAPMVKLLESGLRLGLGTDGPASNNDLNLFGEIRTTALLFKAVKMDPTALPAAQALFAAAPGGASALAAEGVCGLLERGCRADLIIMGARQPHLWPLYHPVSHLVYAANGHEVHTVMVNGRILMRNGRIESFDLQETMARVRELAGRVRS